jgi:peptidoglycan/LPS O-acetylase OafA/YrhL
MTGEQMSIASPSVAARVTRRGTDVARAALGALLVSIVGLLVASATSTLLGRVPHTGWAAVQAMASAALAGGAVLGAMPDWVRRGTWRRGAAAAIALLVGVGVCEAQAALATPLLADGPELAVPLALALVAAPLFTRAAR